LLTASRTAQTASWTLPIRPLLSWLTAHAWVELAEWFIELTFAPVGKDEAADPTRTQHPGWNGWPRPKALPRAQLLIATRAAG
jgi:hypothetical protein